MNRLTVLQPRAWNDALAVQGAPLTAGESRPTIKAGGIDLLDHLKEGLVPEITILNNLRFIADPEARTINGKRIGALATLAQIAANADVRKSAAVIAQAADAAATPQVRNVATAAGNLLQRPRCWYYRQSQFDCLKKGGSQCYAVEGENRYHAIFGSGPCHIVNPSNLANALSVCNGRVITRRAGAAAGSNGSTAGRTIPIADLYTMPEHDVRREHILEPDEIIVEIAFDPVPASAHYEIREKQSFDWPLVMVSVAAQFKGPVISSARICAGAVAPIPWRLPAVEDALVGVSLDDDGALRSACAVATRGAAPMSDNAYKLRLLPVAIARALRLAAGKPIEDVFHHNT